MRRETWFDHVLSVLLLVMSLIAVVALFRDHLANAAVAMSVVAICRIELLERRLKREATQ